MSKKGTFLRQISVLTKRDRQKQFSQKKRRADLQNDDFKFLIFVPRLSYDLSKFSDNFTPFFRL